MAVEMDHTDWSVCFVHASQQRKCDGMITAKSNDAWQCLSMLRDALFVCISVWRSHQEAIVALLDLLYGVGVIVTTEVKRLAKRAAR